MQGPVVGLKKDVVAREGVSRVPRSSSIAWRIAGWFGLLFFVIGLADMALVWYPLRPGNPAWEFGAVDLTFSSLPVVTIGFAGLLASALALGRTRFGVALALIALLVALGCVGGYLLFLSDVPLALRNSPAEVIPGIRKAIFRNSVFAVCFTTAYLAAGIATLRHVRATKREGVNA